MKLRTIASGDQAEVLKIAKALPQWFTSGGLESIQKDLQVQPGIIAFFEDQAVGFLTYFVKQEQANISWMGVLPEFHRRGIGEKLLQELKSILVQQDIKSILVSTLGDSVDYEPYERTRAFYRKHGFTDFQKIAHPDNPEQEEELILCVQI